ncbi:spore maturation protein CgeB [Bosea sp. OAE506]|uniref:CgeB family protein n=1 Tax=Bosea sp. OAE506 TaxID=2663870 RepID=UPI00178B01FC
MRIAFYGSSLLSSYWNGAATYYRGILQGLARLGHDIVFYEPDAFDRQSHLDMEPPDWCRVVVYPATHEGLAYVLAEASEADAVVKASGVGYGDEALLAGVLAQARPAALTIWWDVDAPATLAEIGAQPGHHLRAALPRLDLVLTYGGGEPVVSAYRALGAAICLPVYNALDPQSHHPVAPDPRFAADLAFLGNRLPDREVRVERFFLNAARALPERRFLLGGSGWGDKPCPANIRKLDHVPTAAHNAFNVTPLAVLNISRESMAATGFSPATRVFEAAGAGACLITDAWEGIELFLTPGTEVLVAQDGTDVAEILSALTPEKARRIGQAALARVLAEHTYDRRAHELDAKLRAALAIKRRELAA